MERANQISNGCDKFEGEAQTRTECDKIWSVRSSAMRLAYLLVLYLLQSSCQFSKNIPSTAHLLFSQRQTIIESHAMLKQCTESWSRKTDDLAHRSCLTSSLKKDYRPWVPITIKWRELLNIHLTCEYTLAIATPSIDILTSYVKIGAMVQRFWSGWNRRRVEDMFG